MKKMLSTLIVVILCFGLLFGCSAKDTGKTTESQPEQSSAAANEVQTAQPGTVDKTAQSEPVKVKVFMPGTRKEDANTDLIKEQIKKDTGVECELLLTTNDSWEQKFTLLYSSGEKMDVMTLTPLVYDTYAAQGAFKDISGQYKDYPNLIKYLPEKAWERVKADNKVLGVPKVNTEGKYCLWIRQDWLDKLGLKVPATLDEFYNVMEAFTKQDPDGNKKDDTVGYTFVNLQPFYGAFGVQPGMYTLEGEKVSTNSISENYKKSLQYINKLYANGYMDQESFILKTEKLAQKCISNSVGAFTAWWSQEYVLYNQYKVNEQNPNAKFTILEPPVGPEGKSGMNAQDYLEKVLAIHKDSEVTEAALKLLDYMLSDNGWRTTNYGVKDLHWQMTGDKVTYIGSMVGKDVKGAEINNTNISVYMMFNREDLYSERFIGDTTFTNAQKNGYEKATFSPLISDLFVGLRTDEKNEFAADVTKYEEEMRMKFILGEESFDNWSKYVDKWKSVGGEKVRQSLLKVYNQKYGKSYTFLEP
ncbi:MAG: hypothetical protein ABFD25_11290 [Clostridiaceae bacterium]